MRTNWAAIIEEKIVEASTLTQKMDSHAEVIFAKESFVYEGDRTAA